MNNLKKLGITLLIATIFTAIVMIVPNNSMAASTLPEAENGVITLTEDVVLENTVCIKEKVVLNLNGHTISNTKDIWDDDKNNWSLISVRENGDLTVNGAGEFKAKANDCYALDVMDGGKLTINGGKYVGNIHSIYVYEGSLLVKDGEFTIQQLGKYGYRLELNCRDDMYAAGKASIKVISGKFFKFDPSKDNSEVELAEGYSVAQNGDYYIVSHNCSSTEIKNAVEATATTEGYTGDVVCTVCGKVTEEGKVIPALIQVKNETAVIDVLAVSEAVNEKENLEIKTETATATLDNKVLQSILENVKGNEEIKLKLEKIESDKLNKEQKNAIANKEVSIIISAEILVGDKYITNFNGGKVTIEVPFVPEEGTKGEDYTIVYIADNGEIEELETKYINGNLVVEIEHFSEYAVVKNVVKTEENVEKQEKDNTPKTGSIGNVVYMVLAIVATSVTGIVILNRKK